MSKEDGLEVEEALRLIKALGDAVVGIGTAMKEIEPEEGTLQRLGYLIIDRAEQVVEALGLN